MRAAVTRKTRSGGAAGFAEVSKARLGKAQSPEMLEYVWTPYADIDDENVRAMIFCNMAHTVMLSEQKIITVREAARILGALRRLEKTSGAFPFDPAKGDLFFNVEAYVIETDRKINPLFSRGRSVAVVVGRTPKLAGRMLPLCSPDRNVPEIKLASCRSARRNCRALRGKRGIRAPRAVLCDVRNGM
jgi:hypothetical protein